MNGHFTGPWWDKRNRNRQKRYATDKDYREQQQAAARSNYTPVGKIDKVADLQAATPSANALTRIIDGPGIPKGPRETLTVKELAGVLQMTPKQCGKWTSDGRLPPPVVRIASEQAPPIYLLEEVEAIIPILIKHFSGMRYYRTDHTNTAAAIHGAIHQVRAQLGVTS